MERINNRKYAVTAKEFTGIGVEIERILESIKEKEYGRYSAANLDLETQLAWRIIEGMEEWQLIHNKGVRIFGDTRVLIEIYELHELQKRLDNMVIEFP